MRRARVVVLSCLVVMLALLPMWSEAGDSMSSEISVSALDLDQNLPDVAYNSKRDEYFVVWYDRPAAQAWSVKGRRYSASGDYIGEYVIGLRADPRMDNMHPSVAYDPDLDRYAVVWSCDYSEDGSFYWVYTRIVNWDGSMVTTDFPLRIADEDQFFPRVAYGGTAKEFFITWWTRGEGTSTDAVWVHKIPADGTSTGSAVLSISGPEDRNYPDIAYNQARNEYLIVYQKAATGGGDVVGIRLQGNGTVLGTGEFGIAEWPDDEGAPRVAASRISNTWSVAWHSQVDPTYKDIYVRTVWVDGTGTVNLGPPVHPGTPTADTSNPDISAHPESSNFLVVWQIEYATPGVEYGIWGQVISASGVLGAKFRPRELYSGETHDCSLPAVAGGADDWMVVWQHGRDGVPTYEDIHGRIAFADILKDGFESNDTTGWSATVP
jgi:hypothetical protein